MFQSKESELLIELRYSKYLEQLWDCHASINHGITHILDVWSAKSFPSYLFLLKNRIDPEKRKS